MSDVNNARAVMYGVALGDALGWPIEFLKMDKISIIYGENGIQEPPPKAEVTDETQTSIVIAESLIKAGQSPLEELMGTVTKKLIQWSNSPENTRAPGHTVTEAVRTMEAGVNWRESGGPHAKGNGSAVRVAPIGYFYQHHPDRLREVAHATGIATHAHPNADAAAIAGAYLVKLALDGVSPEDYIDAVISFTKDISTEFVDAIAKVDHVVQWTDEQGAMNYLGSGWIAEEAIAMALYCAMRYQDDYPAAVRRAVNIPGDSDSVGCITGGIVAARVGLSGIPPEWIERLEYKEEITEIALQMAEAKRVMGR